MVPPPVYSRRLLSGNDLGEFSYTVTVPDGVAWVIRDIDVFFDNESEPASWECDLLDPSHVVICIPLYIPNPTALGAHQWRGRQVLESGCELRVITVLGRWYWSISGYVLTVP